MTTNETVGKWTTRFMYAAIAQGLAAFVITALIVLPILKPSPTMLIAGGSAGTWLTVGYLSYLVVGVMGVAVTALFYHLIEDGLHKAVTGISNGLAWAHFVLMNVGVAAATWMLMYAGYIGGTGLLSTASGGGGLTAGQVHPHIVGFVNPIGYAVSAVALGVLLG
ncbi:MAG: hypothetical protein ABSG92_06400, partial [Conexivisphaerales archaeon]